MRFSEAPARHSHLGLTRSWIAVLPLALTLIMGCMKPQSQERGAGGPLAQEEQNATFETDEVKGKSKIDRVTGQSASGGLSGGLSGDASGGLSEDASGASPGGGWRIPVSKLYSFQVCLKDRRTRDPIKGQEFAILGGLETPIVRTDAAGCLYWSERVEYNYFANPKYIHLVRKVQARGLHSGLRILNLAINPWDGAEDGGDEIVDLRVKQIPEQNLVKPEMAQAALNGRLEGHSEPRPLWIDDLRFQIIQKPGAATEGLEAVFGLNMSPKVILRDLNGKTVIRSLPDGHFLVSAWLVGVTVENGKEVRTLITGSEAANRASVVGGKLRAEFDLTFKTRPVQGQVELALRVQPANAPNPRGGKEARGTTAPDCDPKKIKDCPAVILQKPLPDSPAGGQAFPSLLAPFEGVFLMGDFANIFGMKFSEPRPQSNNSTPGFSLETYLRDTLKIEDRAESSGFTKVVAFEFSALEFVVMRTQPSVTATRRKHEFKVKTCVVNPIDGFPVRDVEFTVEKMDGFTQTLRTERDGCMVWNDSLEHKYFTPESYVRKHVTIARKAGDGRDFSQKLEVVLNPWDTNGVFAWDLRYDTPAYWTGVNTQQEQNQRRSELYLPSYGYEALRLRYEIDEFLSLKVKKSFLFHLDPRVLRYSSIRQGYGTWEPLHDGIYLLKIGLQKHYYERPDEPAEFINTVKALVRVQSGRINAPIEFTLKDLRLMRIRGQLLIELATVREDKLDAKTIETLESPVVDLDELIDSESGLRARTFVGPIVPVANEFGSSLRPTDQLNEVNCRTIDCDQMKRADQQAVYESDIDVAKYFGKITHLANKSVTDLIREQQELDRKHREMMEQNSKLERFLLRSNAEYLQLTHRESIAKEGLNLAQLNMALPSSGDAKPVIERLNVDLGERPPYRSVRDSKVSEEDLRNIILKKEISKELASRLCHYWWTEFIPRVAKLANAASARTGLAAEQCFYDLDLPVKPEEMFIIERRMRVHELKDYRFMGGKAMNFQVSTDFSLSHSEVVQVSRTATFSPTAWLKLLPWEAVTSLASAFSYSIARSTQKGTQLSGRTGFSSSSYLGTQRAEMEMTFGTYEHCAVIRMNPDYADRYNVSRQISKLVPEGMTPAILSRGIFICTGERLTKPLAPQPEHYYYFSQQFADDTVLDHGESLNQPWLLGLRGHRDYVAFVAMIQGKRIRPEQIEDDVDIADHPLDQLQQAYRRVLPSFPKMYSLE